MKKIIRTFLLGAIAFNGLYNSAIAQSFAGGSTHSLSVCSDGTAKAWGDSNWGKLGNGTAPYTLHASVVGLTGVIAIAAGGNFSMALKNDGTVWTWGENFSGQMGDGTTTQKTTPAQVMGISNVIAIAAGYSHCLALKSDGTVWAWGDNAYGEIGDGTTIERHAPVQTDSIDNVVSISCGTYHSLAVKSDGTAWAWGRNHKFQLGIDAVGNSANPYPRKMTGLSGITALAGGFYHSMALKNNGTVWVCGDNSSYQIGDGTSLTRTAAVQLSSISGVVAIGCGSHHSMAMKNDGTLWTWGNNASAQLGDGTTNGKDHPVQVSSLCTLQIGIEEYEPSYLLNIYPNPSTGIFNIDGITTETFEVEVFNILGEMRLKQKDNKLIDISSAPKGLYFVKLTEGSHSFTKKVILE